MLNSINISHIFVSDQDEALDFWTKKTGSASPRTSRSKTFAT